MESGGIFFFPLIKFANALKCCNLRALLARRASFGSCFVYEIVFVRFTEEYWHSRVHFTLLLSLRSRHKTVA